MNSDSILILGTGALATLFAARFAAKGMSVTMLGTWREGLAILNEKGARVDGDEQAYRVHATNNPTECKGVKYALVLVKAWQTERVAHQLAKCLVKDGLALTLQNGLGNNDILTKILGQLKVAQGVTTLGATMLAPGLVCMGGEGPVLLESHPRITPLQEMISRVGFEVNVVDNVLSLVWGKLVVSSAINPLTALLRVKNGELINRPPLRGLMRELAGETAMVAKSLGVSLPFLDPGHAAEEVVKRTAENQSSMLQDILRGAPTEINEINGAIVQLAKEKHLQVPVNRTVLALVNALPVRGKIEN